MNIASNAAFIAIIMTAQQQDNPRPRIRDVGVSPGLMQPGPLNAITDVAGVRVGQRTIIEGDSIRTGVTAILPHGGNLFQEKVPAAVFVGNGFGKAAGFLQVRELGNIEAPIILTNTLCVGRGIEGAVKWTLAQPGNESVQSVNAVVGETNDGYLNDIRGMRVSVEDVITAIEAAKAGGEGRPVEEGSVGAGTGTRCFGWKGGIGTSSRILNEREGSYTVGALVQTNFGGNLTIDGVRVGEKLRAEQRSPGDAANPTPRHSHASALRTDASDGAEAIGGSCMIVIATDAPLSSRNLGRLAQRAVLGLACTGSVMSNGSGDFVIAFSTKNLVPHAAPTARTLQIEELPNDAMTPLFQATVEAVEEAVYNSLTKATTVTGYRGHTVEAIPIARLREVMKTRD